MDVDIHERGSVAVDPELIAQYRREGYTVLRRVLDTVHVADCLAALSRLAEEPGAGGTVAIEPGIDPATVTAATRLDNTRKFADFIDREPALMRAAMSARLHGALDRILGCGRVLFQEMALVKPPRIGGVKPWHQDAAYFRGSDPDLVFGVWIALDPATTENGCMEVVPRSHRVPVPHVPAEDINACTIREDHVRWDARIPIPLDPGDVLVFHSLVHHYTAANRSGMRRRALQFHYHQIGMEWVSHAAHRAQFHDERGEFAGCIVPKGQAVADENAVSVPRRAREVIPVE
jgi:phytanoyl-CoA hydroxylase